MGKSTVLGQEAQAAKTSVVTVRSFLEGAAVTGGVPAFLDGLDEYRSDRGQRADKVERLATGLHALALPGWRLSCRAEDWSDADREALERAAAPGQIVVARLEPLDGLEARAILSAMGEVDPEAFRARADGLGATAFLETPLSIKLLVRATRDTGEWPATRFALFDSATQRLAHEHDSKRGRDIRRDPVVAIRDACRICALLLLANRGAIWYSAAPPTPGLDGRDYLPASELGLDRSALANTLDTALFRQIESDVFVPMHRVVAEFLAGEGLAAAVAGGHGQARYPLSRALALIANTGGRAPSELRGVYAWTAVHLSRLGLHLEAERMIQQDAVTVLVYGDAALLSTPERRILLANLDRHDPWFRSVDDSDTAVAGLAGADLVPEFEAILRDRNQVSHSFLTVTDALTYGRPVRALAPLLFDIAMDPSRPDGHRLRAAEAWVAIADDKDIARLELFRAAAALGATQGTLDLRTTMASRLPASLPEDIELENLLVDYSHLPDSVAMGRLSWLAPNLRKHPRPALLERDWPRLFDDGPPSNARIEIEHLIESNFVAVLHNYPTSNGKDVWRWLANLQRYATDDPGRHVVGILQSWLQSSPHHEVELFHAIAVAEADTGTWSGWPTRVYLIKCGVLPSVAVVRALLFEEGALHDEFSEDKRLEMAVGLAATNGCDSTCFWSVFDYLRAHPDHPEANARITALTTCVIDHHRQDAFRKRAVGQQEKEKEQRDREVAFQREVVRLADGTAIRMLEQAALLRFGHNRRGETSLPGFKGVEDMFGRAVATAIASGWRHLALHGFGVGPKELGEIDSLGQRYFAECPALAGLDLFLTTCPSKAASLPVTLALIVLRSEGVASEDAEARSRLQRWAVERLEAAGTEGRSALIAMWSATLDASPKRPLVGISVLRKQSPAAGVAASALSDILRARPAMQVDVLSSSLSAASRLVAPDELLAIAQYALSAINLGEPSYELWLCVAFALAPASYRSKILAHYIAQGTSDLAARYSLMEVLAASLATQRILFAETVCRILAPLQNPASVEPWSDNPIQASLAWLRDSPDPLATIALRNLESEPSLVQWQVRLRHVLAQQARIHLDRSFVSVPLPAIRDALAGGPPINAVDLQAVVVDQLRHIQHEMQVDPLMPWQAYWNEGSKNRPATPKVENSCRNVLGQQLKARLTPFGIAIPPMPEAQLAKETRVDVLLLSGAGANLPIEIKRHFHPQVWQAAETQLQGYAANPGASGLGIFLVFWFGLAPPPPSRGKGKAMPTSAAEMEAMLRVGLPEQMRETTHVVVLDVSDPRATSLRAARTRMPKKAPAKARSNRRGKAAIPFPN